MHAWDLAIAWYQISAEGMSYLLEAAILSFCFTAHKCNPFENAVISIL